MSQTEMWNMRHSCVKRSDLSGLEKFEGLDPAWWVNHGYAIAHVDARGSGNSDGDAVCMGAQEAEDAHDVIEALAKLPWCNGNVGMAGNSYLAIMQWQAAAQNPPSLKAIAPWEGSGDIFREQFCRGGWFNMSNFDLITALVIKGHHGNGSRNGDACLFQGDNAAQRQGIVGADDGIRRRHLRQEALGHAGSVSQGGIAQPDPAFL